MSPENQPTADRPLAIFVTGDTDEGGIRLPIATTAVDIGQGPQNDVVLDDDTVSTRHARLEYAAVGWRLTDLESKNGTYVDGVRLAPGIPTPLPNQAGVAFGAYKLRFVADTGLEPDAAPKAAPRGADRVPLAERSAFRLPVWLVVLLILFVALLVALFVLFGGDPQTVEPVVEPVTAQAIQAADRLAA